MIFENIDEDSSFAIAYDFLSKILTSKEIISEINSSYGDFENLILSKRTISYIIYDGLSIYNDCLNIIIDILNINKEKIGYYSLYIDKNKKFIDEFFIID